MSAIEDKVCEKIQARAAHGLEKYGTTMERKDLSPVQWLNHLHEELLDASVYTQRLLDEHAKFPMECLTVEQVRDALQHVGEADGAELLKIIRAKTAACGQIRELRSYLAVDPLAPPGSLEEAARALVHERDAHAAELREIRKAALGADGVDSNLKTVDLVRGRIALEKEICRTLDASPFESARGVARRIKQELAETKQELDYLRGAMREIARELGTDHSTETILASAKRVAKELRDALAVAQHNGQTATELDDKLAGVRRILKAAPEESVVEAAERVKATADAAAVHGEKIAKIREFVGASLGEDVVHAVRRAVDGCEARLNAVRATLGANPDETTLQAAERAIKSTRGLADVYTTIMAVRRALDAEPSETVVQAAHRVAGALSSKHEDLVKALKRLMMIRSTLRAKSDESAEKAAERLVKEFSESRENAQIAAQRAIELDGRVIALREALGVKPDEPVLQAARRIANDARCYAEVRRTVCPTAGTS